MATDTQPLAALLASHPDAVADALAWLVERSTVRGVPRYAARRQGLELALDALSGDGIAQCGGSFYWLAEHIDARAIARIGAAAWLRERCGVAASTHEERAATVRDLEAAFRRGEGVEVASSGDTGAGAPAKGEQQ